jgi:putative NADH-flavin reductase
MRFFILGATGGTGAQLTRQALDRGHAVTAFVRSPEKMAPCEKLQIVRGDPRDAGELEQALREHDAVLSALGSTGKDGFLEAAARSTLEAMRRTNVRRLTLVSMALLFPDVGPAGPVLRLFLRHHMRDSAAMEKVIEASNVDWTIVRPPRLTNGSLTGKYCISERHAPPSFSIPRADCASAILDFVEKGEYVSKVIGVST